MKHWRFWLVTVVLHYPGMVLGYLAGAWRASMDEGRKQFAREEHAALWEKPPE